MPNYKKIYIRLFGTFDITVNKKSVLTKGIRQQGFNKLLVFFILNQGRVFEINTLIDKVWPNKDYQDNNSIMRTRIFRLKRQLAELVPSLDFNLEFTRGGYCFTYDQKNVVMDTDIFENICSKVFSSKQSDFVNSDLSVFDPDAQKTQGGEREFSVVAPHKTTPAATASSGPLTPPSIGAFTQGRTERMANRGVDSFNVRVQYSDSEILKLCSDALRIYQNGFLSESSFDGSWLESYRQNYRRMWIKIIKTFTELCYRAQNYSDIISLCQEVLRFEDTEEYIHEIYMDALRNAGYHQDALRHFEIISAMPTHGEAFINSSRLRDLNKNILRETDSNNKLIDEGELEQVITDMTDEDASILYEKDVFLKHCSVLRLHSERSVYRPYICILETLGFNTDDSLVKRLSNISYLTYIAKNVFRKSDILCEWNDRQVLVLMACNQNFGAEKLTQRIKLAILRDNLTPEEEANEELNLSERMYYLPLNVKFMPIGTSVA